nr:DUF4175 family protein [Phaeovibrio sulfidiphilus]
MPFRFALVWLILLWEQFWRAFWKASTALAAVLAFVFLGGGALLPLWLHVGVLALVAAGLSVAVFRGARRFRLPTRGDTLHRLDLESGPHRPFGAASDTLSVGLDDPLSRALWERHLSTARDAAMRLRPGWPRTGVGREDRFFLRWVAFGALVLSLAVGVVSPGPALVAFLTPPLIPPPEPVTARLWLTPPDYTGLPPRSFDTQAPGPSEPVVQVPQGTTLLALVHGPGEDARLVAGVMPVAFETLDARSRRAGTVLEDSGTLSLEVGGKTLFERTLEVVPDAAPKVRIGSLPESGARGRLVVPLEASDDYGLRAVGVEIAPRALDMAGSTPLDLPLAEPWNTPKTLKMTGSMDLTEHPWAGMPVRLTPFAIDTAGRRGTGAPVETVLPERIFNNPLAREVIRIRKVLAHEYVVLGALLSSLDAVSARVQEDHGDLTVYLALREVRAHLAQNGRNARIDEMSRTLWRVALRIEDGAGARINESLDTLRQRLDEALSGDLSQAEVQRLIQEVNEALARMSLDAMQMLQEADPSGALSGSMDLLSSLGGAQDLRDLVRDLDDLNRMGARDATRSALERLSSALSTMGAGRITEQQLEALREVNEFSRALARIAEDQATLLDETFHKAVEAGETPDAPESASGPTREGSVLAVPDRPGRAGAGAGRRAHPRPFQEPDPDSLGLAIRQDEISGRLESLMEEVARQTGDIPKDLGEAGVAMVSAREHLERGALQAALVEQRNALEKLARSRQSMAQSLARSLGLSAGLSLPMPGGTRAGPGLDPLGRPLPDGRSPGAPDGDVLPDQVRLQKAREILDELRRRANDPDRSNSERDYIERLIPGF